MSWIAEFVASWSLFSHTWLAGWLIAVLLSLTGVWAVARDQIFVGAAVAQASSLGVAVLFAVCGWLGLVLPPENDALHGAVVSATAVAAAMLASLITSRRGRESHEALTGWVYLVAASSATLLVARQPEGFEEVQRLVLSGSILGVATHELVVVAALTAAAVAIVALAHRRLILLALDPTFAAAMGARPRTWSIGFALWLGLAAGVAIHVAGVVYCFGCLVLPALIAKRWCRELRSSFALAPLIALAVTAVAFVVANHLDLPPGQVAVTTLGVVLLLSWLATWWGPLAR